MWYDECYECSIIAAAREDVERDLPANGEGEVVIGELLLQLRDLS